MLTPLKNFLARAVAESLLQNPDIKSLPGFNLEDLSQKLCGLFETPKDLAHGHLALPFFFLAKELKKAPPVIAKEIAQKLLTSTLSSKIQNVESVVAVGGYVNFHFNELFLLQSLVEEAQKNTAHLGHSKKGAGKTVVIDYSSPNVAKPMHVGHLRATMIGQAIRNLAETQGYTVIGLNHLGDWGVQFGKLAYAYKQWGAEYPFETEPFESLFKLYVRFHAEAEKNPDIERLGAQEFKKLEEGDAELRKLWLRFIEISMKDFDRLWKRLGVKHDIVRGESFYNDRLKATEDLLTAKGLLVESEGAMVVDLSDEKIPPCLIRKSDGASLYATRDIASAIYRHDELKADLSLYVVGNDQNLHFKQVFSVLRRMGFAWWKTCHHISFGMYRFKDVGKMSSRKGQIIRLEDLLNKAVSLVRDVMKEKNPDLPNFDQVAEEVGVGAIIFNDLVNDRVRDVEFDWNKAVSFDGDSGPYLQYVYVRCSSILQKYGKTVPSKVIALPSEEERQLVKTLYRYEEVLADGFENFKPNILANYLLELSAAFNKFYHQHRILGGDEELLPSRIALVHATKAVIRSGLGVLNIKCPEAM